MATRKLTADQIHERLRKLEDRANVAAYVVLDKDGGHIGTIRFHYPKDGAGRLTCAATNWDATPPEDSEARMKWTCWQLGWANGYGYDKHTAAMSGMTMGECRIVDNGHRWDSQLSDSGYRVLQAV